MIFHPDYVTAIKKELEPISSDIVKKMDPASVREMCYEVDGQWYNKEEVDGVVDPLVEAQMDAEDESD